MPAARVHCEGCGFAWYGEGSAHGLSVIGHCPRCGGELRFVAVPELAAAQEASAGEPDGARQAPIAPSRVLGVPLGWT